MPSPIFLAGQSPSPSNKGICFFVDLDGVLKSAENNAGSYCFSLNDQKYLFEKNPEADAFLSELRKLGKVVLCTASTKRYSENALEKMGVTSCFETVYTREAFRQGLPSYDLSIFIDDNLEIGCFKRDFQRPLGHQYVCVMSSYHGGSKPCLLDRMPWIKDIVKAYNNGNLTKQSIGNRKVLV